MAATETSTDRDPAVLTALRCRVEVDETPASESLSARSVGSFSDWSGGMRLVSAVRRAACPSNEQDIASRHYTECLISPPTTVRNTRASRIASAWAKSASSDS
ncbi:Uncharacterised protein [Mycobacteroides abscessus subsp. abscessus]|nr:Uncharacterised protein [Mycobacteroides abscessus subsp. abscessus]